MNRVVGVSACLALWVTVACGDASRNQLVEPPDAGAPDAAVHDAASGTPPSPPSNGAGYGLVRFDTAAKTVTFECWPRDADVTKPSAKQFTGWPMTVTP